MKLLNEVVGQGQLLGIGPRDWYSQVDWIRSDCVSAAGRQCVKKQG